jgi:hypothetical protein
MGWNARDPVAQMRPLYAVVMDNMFPRSADVQLRSGAANHLTGITGTVKSLLNWTGPTSEKLFCATDAGIFDASSAGVVGASVAAVTSGQMISTNIRTAGGSYMYAVNGVDKPWLYDGTTWTAIDGVSVPALTGLTTTSISYVYLFKSRLWFIEEDSLSVWYLAVNSIGGALTEFPLGGVFRRGGYLMAMASWTLDGGDGSDDLAVFVSSEGEVAIYKGTDPASASTWALVGLYFIGTPLGRKCFCKFGGDLLYLSQRGATPLSKLVQAVSVDRTIQITYTIDNAFVDAVQQYSANYGWQAVQFPKAGMILVNVPASTDGSYSQQFVMNMVTGGWCRFTGWNASCFEVYNDELYFGMTGKVVKAWTGTSDFGANIVGSVQQAFNYFSPKGGQKQITLVRPITQSSDSIEVSIGLDVDFDQSVLLGTASIASSGYGIFDASLWDIALWGPDTITNKRWRTIASKPGFCFAFRLQVSSNNVEFTWASTDYVYTVGGVL